MDGPVPVRGGNALHPPDAAAYRQAFRRTAGGVWVVTAAHAGQRSGLTVTSVISLSAQPPELMMSVQQGSSSFPLLQAAGHFGVNLLTNRQQAIAERFAGRGGCQGEARYADAAWHTTAEGVWLLADAAVAMACEVVEVVWRRTHALVIGRVAGLRLESDATAPLIYCDGRYTEPQPRE